MKNILLLFARQSKVSGAADPKYLAAQLDQADVDMKVEYAYFEDAEYVLNSKDVRITLSGTPLESYDVIYFRYWGLPEVQSHALAIARYCKIKGIAFIDSEVLRTGSFNKINQYINLFEANVPFPSTVICKAASMVELTKHHLSFPLVAKDARGTRGSNNFLVESLARLEEIALLHSEKTFVLQQYVANEGDYRVFVTGNKPDLIIYRQAVTGNYLNNTSQGASATLVADSEVPTRMLQDAVTAARFFGRDIAGVDMVLDEDGNHYCFEVNRAPQIEHSSFEKEKINVVAKYLRELSNGH